MTSFRYDIRDKLPSQTKLIRIRKFLKSYLDSEVLYHFHTFIPQPDLNSSDPRSSDPSFAFLAAVNEGTTLFAFFEKAMNECIGPLLAYVLRIRPLVSGA